MARVSSIIMAAVAFLVADLFSLDVVAAAEGPRVPVGVAKVDITPETPIRMYGYRARTTESERVAGRLKASALVIGGDEAPGPAVLLAVDCGAVPQDMRDEVYRRVAAKHTIRPARFVLCNSHNHSGPDLKHMARIEGAQHERLQQYGELLIDRLEQVVLAALKARRPGRLAWAQGSVGFAANRRVLKDGRWVGFGAVHDAPVDHSVPVLRVTDDQGKLRAVVVNYACHNTTLRGNFKEIHGDWAGCAQKHFETEHPGATALITIGCGADADPCPHSTVELCQQHGRALADEVSRLLDEAEWKPLPPTIQADTKVLEMAPIEGATQKADPQPGEFTVQVTTWTFDDKLAMLFFSDEVVVDYVLRLKREFDPDRLWVSAYTNDVSGYIVTQRLIGEGGYEVRTSLSHKLTGGKPARLDPPMEKRIFAAVHELLPESFARRDGSP